MTAANKKTLLVDFSDLADFCGFGEIERNYAPRLATAMQDEVNLIYIVPTSYIGRFGDKVTYIDRHTTAREISKAHPRIDLWHSSHQLLGIMPGKRIPRLLTIHDVNFLHEKKGLRKLKHIIRLKRRMKRSVHIVTISQYVKDELCANFPTYGLTVDVIHNGIATNGSDMCRPEFVDGAKPFLFTVGQIRAKKNLDKLVHMMRHLPEYNLYISGDDHFAHAGDLRKLIGAIGDGHVFLTGKITDEEKRWMFANTSGYLFPSALEGFGLTGLEAMRYNCPVFCSRLSSLPEVCGTHAFYWDNFDPAGMADTVRKGIAKFASDPAIGAEAHKHSESFNYDRYTDQYVALYRKLLAK